MPTTPEGFQRRLDRLKADLVQQAGRAQRVVEGSIEAVFELDPVKARAAIALDEEIDRVDVEIERTAVALLEDATRQGAGLNADQLRLVLTIVKVNNELERIADAGVAIAERVAAHHLPKAPPQTFRVMANSVIGILESTTRGFDAMDTRLARVVLASDEAVVAFKEMLLRESQEQIAAGKQTVDLAFGLHTMASHLERVADHCTNIAEQVIYLATGSIVRHLGGRWTEPAPAG